MPAPYRAETLKSQQDATTNDAGKLKSTEWNLDDTSRIYLPSFTQQVVHRVLIVDDDPLMRERLEYLVCSAGFEVLTASTGREALETLRRDYCPIVVSDWTMPDMDGLALCKTLREESFPGYVYILLLTARDAQQDILAGLHAGADDYLSKRVTEAELVARLRTAKRIVGLEQSMRELIDEKRRLSTTDALTGVNNRLYFDKYLTRELKRVRRFGGALSVLLLDIDHFKAVNDRYGHGIGDEVLVDFSARITAALPRDYDWCARVGGEEFAVVLPQTDLSGAKVVAEKLRQYVGHAPLRTGAGPIPVTVSIGVVALSCIPAGVEPTLNLLTDMADRALYASKENGRNRVTSAA